MRGLVLSGVGVLLAVALAGCSSGSDADGQPATKLPPTRSSDPITVVPSTSVSPSPRPTPKPTPSKPAKPTLPAVAKQDTAAGAAAAADYWLGALTYGMQTGDTSPLRDVSGQNCKTCDNFASTIEMYVHGGNVVAAKSPFRRLAIHVLHFDAHRGATLDFKFVTGQLAVRKDGKNRLGDPPETARTTTMMNWRDGRWILASMELD